MALSDVYAALEASRSGDRIDLAAAVAAHEAVLGRLGGVLDVLRVSAGFTVDLGEIREYPTDVTLRGEADYGLSWGPARRVSVLLVATTPTGQDPAFVLTLSVLTSTAAWTFDATFPTLPGCEQYDGRVVLPAPSFLIGLRVDAPSFVARIDAEPARVALDGLLPLAPVLERFADFFGPFPLRLAGPVSMPAAAGEPPELDLVALAPSASSQAGPLRLRDVGMALAAYVDVEPDGTRTAFSTLEYRAVLDLAGVPVVIRAPLLSSAELWPLYLELEDGRFSLAAGLGEIASLLGIPAGDLRLPQPFPAIGSFYLSSVEVGIFPAARGLLPAPAYAAVVIRSDETWQPPIPHLAITGVGTRWLLLWQAGGSTAMRGAVFGQFVVGKEETFTLNVAAYVPDFGIYGNLASGDTIPLRRLFEQFFGDPGPPTRPELAITAFSFSALPLARTFSASAEITTPWSVELGDVTIGLTSVEVHIEVVQGSISGGLGALFELRDGQPPGADAPVIAVGAEYAGSGSAPGWVFRGDLVSAQPIELVGLVAHFFHADKPDYLPNLVIRELSLRFATGTGAFAFAGAVISQWSPELFGRKVALEAGIRVAADRASRDVAAQGSVTGRFAIDSFAVTVAVSITGSAPTYLFQIEFDGVWLSVTVTTRVDPATSESYQVLTVSLGGVTLGDIVEYFVNLAVPGGSFTLDAPWGVLKRIDLSRFALTVAPTRGEVGFTYAANVDLGVLSVRTVGLRYRRVRGEPSVDLVVTGRLLGTVYDEKNPLSWDVLSQSPPALPGTGPGAAAAAML